MKYHSTYFYLIAYFLFVCISTHAQQTVGTENAHVIAVTVKMDGNKSRTVNEEELSQYGIIRINGKYLEGETQEDIEASNIFTSLTQLSPDMIERVRKYENAQVKDTHTDDESIVCITDSLLFLHTSTNSLSTQEKPKAGDVISGIDTGNKTNVDMYSDESDCPTDSFSNSRPVTGMEISGYVR